jgi:soluble lytic murein transglycosylase-like protein
MTALLCLLMLGPLAGDVDRLGTCHDIRAEARAQGVPVPVVLSVAWVESRFNAEAVSRAGAVGPLQVLPRYYPGPPIAEGVAKLRRLYVKKGSWELAWCHYNAGNVCTARGRAYADKVAARLRHLDSIVPDGLPPAYLLPPGKL